MRTHACLVPNLNHVTKKTRTRTQHVQDKNPIRFYSKNETRTNKVVTKKTYPKLVLNKLKVIKSPTSIYTPWAPNSKKLP
jgi:hypothetical protein